MPIVEYESFCTAMIGYKKYPILFIVTPCVLGPAIHHLQSKLFGLVKWWFIKTVSLQHECENGQNKYLRQMGYWHLDGAIMNKISSLWVELPML